MLSMSANLSHSLILATNKTPSFLRMLATATAGGTVTVYSDRFTLTGMTGTFASTFTVSGTDGPADENDVSDTTATTSSAAAAADGVYGTPYQSQTGLTRYAPMQPVPGNSITATDTAPQYPTSAYTIATTYLESATILITVTQAQTASFSSHANTVRSPVEVSPYLKLTIKRPLLLRCLRMICRSS